TCANAVPTTVARSFSRTLGALARSRPKETTNPRSGERKGSETPRLRSRHDLAACESGSNSPDLSTLTQSLPHTKCRDEFPVDYQASMRGKSQAPACVRWLLPTARTNPLAPGANLERATLIIGFRGRFVPLERNFLGTVLDVDQARTALT